MADFIRILGKQSPDINIAGLRELLKEKDITGTLELPEGKETRHWSVLNVFNGSGEYMMQVVRCPVAEGEHGLLVLAALEQSLINCKPASGAAWIREYFGNVAVVYLFQMHCNSRIYPPNYSIEDSILDSELVDTVIKYMWKHTGGIMQTDGDGYTNEEGDTILWQYEGHVLTNRDCAVTGPDGKWITFNMDTADATQMQEFLEGKRPQNAADQQVG